MKKRRESRRSRKIGDATAAKIGRQKYGKTGMMKMQKKGMKADMVPAQAQPLTKILQVKMAEC